MGIGRVVMHLKLTKMTHQISNDISNRNVFLKHHSPHESQLILLHVSVFSYLYNICEKLVGTWDSGGGRGNDIPQPEM